MLDMLARTRRARPYQSCWLVNNPILGPADGRLATCSTPLNISAANEFLGAKLGANDARHQATPGHVQPELPQVNGTQGDTRPHPATV
jgi:hypothetical protein